MAKQIGKHCDYASAERLSRTRFLSSPAQLMSRNKTLCTSKEVTPYLSATVLSIQAQKLSGRRVLSSQQFVSVPTKLTALTDAALPPSSLFEDGFTVGDGESCGTGGAVVCAKCTLTPFASVALPVARAISLGKLEGNHGYQVCHRLATSQFTSSPPRVHTSTVLSCRDVTPYLSADVLYMQTQQQAGKRLLSSHRFGSVPPHAPPMNMVPLQNFAVADGCESYGTGAAVLCVEQGLTPFAQAGLLVARAVSLGKSNGYVI